MSFVMLAIFFFETRILLDFAPLPNLSPPPGFDHLPIVRFGYILLCRLVWNVISDVSFFRKLSRNSASPLRVVPIVRSG